MFFGPPLFRILNFDYSIYKYHTITVRIFLLHTRSISLGILDYQLLWQNVNVNFFPLLMLLYVYTITKPKQNFWNIFEKVKKRNLASWIVIFSACVLLQSVLHLHQLIVVYINKQLYILFGFSTLYVVWIFDGYFQRLKNSNFESVFCI